MSEPRITPRTYRSELRQQRAAQTRRRVVEAAVALFSTQGYGATTFAQLAERAGVSVKTVQEQGSKSALLRAAVELASFGVEGETDFFNTDLGRAFLQVRSPDGVATTTAEAMLTINAPSAALWTTVVSAAHADPELARYHAQMLALIRAQVAHILGYLGERGWLRTDVAFDELVEAFCVITCVETYVRFITHDQKSPDQYTAFVSRTVRETILAH